MAPYPFNFSTVDRQLEVLRLWSNAELNNSSALLVAGIFGDEHGERNAYSGGRRYDR